MCEFTHLHVHSEYSLLDGYATTKGIVERAVELGMESIALTDHGVMYGAMDFYHTAKKGGIKPIIGVEAFAAPGSRHAKWVKGQKNAMHLLLLAQNMQGYRNLAKLTTQAHIDMIGKGVFSRPRIDWELLEQHSEGVIATSSCIAGEVIQALQARDTAGARRIAAKYRDLFGPDRYFLELQLHPNAPELESLNDELVRIGAELGIATVATADTHFLRPDDLEAQRRVMAMGFNKTLSDFCQMGFAMDSSYAIASADDMWRLFQRYGTAPIENTQRIASMCQLDMSFGAVQLPPFAIPAGHTAESYLRHVSEEGLARRFGGLPPAHYAERLYYELDVINQTKFPDYILIVWDYISFAKNRGIPFLPRGSAGASLVLYALGVTDVDPIVNKLLFERFLSPERLEMPDIDTDFADTRRGEVLEYISQKYGQGNVAQIMTYSTLGAKQAIRDMGKVLEIPLPQVDQISKLIPPLPAGVTIQQSLEKVADLRSLYDGDTQVRDWLNWAMRVEGRMKTVGTHACGLVVSHSPLSDMVPLQPTKDGGLMASFEGPTLAKMGLLKMDILGLSNLSIVAEALRFIEDSTGKHMWVTDIPLDDPKTFKALARGETKDVFQLESDGMTRYLMQLKPTHVGDLYAMVALYRPGPLEQLPRYIECKNDPSTITYIHPILKPILEDTYGVIVYQEQIMALLQAIAGYTLGQAYIVLKAIGKKNKELMASEQPRFVQGCLSNGLTNDQANTLWQLIQPFAGYSFNRPHSTLYGLLAYQTAWLKNNYPTEYMAAVLTANMSSVDDMAQSAMECRRLGVPILGPSVNASENQFTIVALPNNQRGIRFGLNAIRHLGASPVQAILDARGDRPFGHLDDFCARVKGIPKKSVETLIKAGAFDDIPDSPSRHQLVEMCESAVQAGATEAKRLSAGQSSFFDSDTQADAVFHRTTIPLAPTGPHVARERLLWEHEAIGMYLSAHPLNTAGLNFDGTTFVAAINEDLVGQTVQMVVLIREVKRIPTKRDYLLSILCEDLTGQIEVVGYVDRVEQVMGLLEPERVVRISGEVSQRRSLQVVLDRVSDGSGDPFPVEKQKRRFEAKPKSKVATTAVAALPDVAVEEESEVSSAAMPKMSATAVLRKAQQRMAQQVPQHDESVASGQTLFVTLQRSTDAVSDRHTMYAIASLFKAYPGADEVRMHVPLHTGGFETIVAKQRIRLCNELVFNIAAMLGKAAIAVRSTNDQV